MGSPITGATVRLLAKSAKSAVKRTILNLYAKAAQMGEKIEIVANQDTEVKAKGKNSMK